MGNPLPKQRAEPRRCSLGLSSARGSSSLPSGREAPPFPEPGLLLQIPAARPENQGPKSCLPARIDHPDAAAGGGAEPFLSRRSLVPKAGQQAFGNESLFVGIPVSHKETAEIFFYLGCHGLRITSLNPSDHIILGQG